MPTDALDWRESVAALREFEGRDVAVRIALQDRNEVLVAVVHAELGAMDVDASAIVRSPSHFDRGTLNSWRGKATPSS